MVKDIKEFKASYGSAAELPDPIVVTAKAPGDSKDQGDKENPMQGSSEKGKFKMIGELTKRLSEMAKDEVAAIHAAVMENDSQSEDATINDTSTISKVTRSEVDVSEDLAAVFAGADLTEEFKSKATEIFEAAVVAKINEKIAEIAEESENEINITVAALSEELNDKIDTYLEYVVEQWMDENKLAVEAGLKTQMTEQFLQGLHTLFAEHYVNVPEDKVDVIQQLADKVDELEESLSTEITKNVELNARVGDFEKEIIFAEATEGLTETQVSKLESLSESIVYNDVETFKKKIQTIRESYFPLSTSVNATKSSLDEEPIDEYTDTHPVDSSMKPYMDAITRSIKK